MCGVQRVPTFDPKPPLSTLHLEDYTILDCEPLHDLKGHLLQELPYLFKGEDRSDIIQATTSNTMTGAKFRVCMIQLFHKRSTPSEVLMVIETAVRMSELLYMEAYPSFLAPSWTLQLITNFHKKMTYNTFFGTYLHSLVVHAPQQMALYDQSTRRTKNDYLSRLEDPHQQLAIDIHRMSFPPLFSGCNFQRHAQKISDNIVSKAGTDIPTFGGIPSHSLTFITEAGRSIQNQSLPRC